MDLGCTIADMTSSEVSALGSLGKLEQSCCAVSTDVEGRDVPKDGDGNGGTSPCERVKCELAGYHALPDYLRDNEFILRYYRSEWPLKQTLLSVFSVHNETINVWTHLAGFFVFLVLTLNTAMVLPRTTSAPSGSVDVLTASGPGLCKERTEMAASARSLQEIGDGLKSSSPPAKTYSSCIEYLGLELLAECSPRNVACSESFPDARFLECAKEDGVNMIAPLPLEPVTRWPFFAFLCGSMFCLLTSSVCHLISCHSERTAYIMLRLDYVGISALIVTSFYPLVFYSFMCHPFLCNLYMGFITAFGVVTISISLVPVFQTAEFRPLRAGIFFCMGFSGLVPTLHKLVAFGHRPEVLLSAGYELLMGVFYGLGVVVYATRIPERWTPGKFDLVGHSHQLFHVLVIAGAYAHYLACLAYLQWRDVDQYC